MTAPELRLEEATCPCCGGRGGEVVARSKAQLSPDSTRFEFVRCASCDLIRLGPRVPPAAIGAYYDPSYLPHRGASAWGRYAPLVERAEAATDRARVRLVRAAGLLHESSRVLDVGCGRPTFLAALRASVGCQCVGLDFSDHGWRGEPRRWQGLELVQGELATTELRTGFDLITMWHALEHDYDPVASLQRLRALAAPGARLVVEVPNHDSLTRRWHGDAWAGYHTPRHTMAFSPATLRQVLERSGWRLRQVQTWGTLDPYVLWWLGRQERLGRDLSGDLAPYFAGFLAGRIAATPLLLLQRWISLGAQTAVAEAADS